MSYPSVRAIETQHRQIGDSRRNSVWDFLTANLGDKGSCTPGPLHMFQLMPLPVCHPKTPSSLASFKYGLVSGTGLSRLPCIRGR